MKSDRASQKPPRSRRAAKAARQGSPPVAAIMKYMPLVHQVVFRFLRRLPPNVLRDDLVAAGTFGLIDALRKSGKTLGPTFDWYARIRIRGAIFDELRSQDWLTRRARNRVTATIANLAPGEIAPPRSAVIGFDDLPIEVRTRNFIDGVGLNPQEAAEETFARDALARAIAVLPEREMRIVRMHYFQGIPFKAIAAALSVSEPRISQLHARAMTLLKGIITKRNNAAA